MRQQHGAPLLSYSEASKEMPPMCEAPWTKPALRLLWKNSVLAKSLYLELLEAERHRAAGSRGDEWSKLSYRLSE